MQGLQRTQEAASPSVGIAAIVIRLVVFVFVYGALAVVDWTLMVRYARKKPAPVPDATEAESPVLEPSY